MSGPTLYTYVWNNPTNLTDPTGFTANGTCGGGSAFCYVIDFVGNFFGPDKDDAAPPVANKTVDPTLTPSTPAAAAASVDTGGASKIDRVAKSDLKCEATVCGETHAANSGGVILPFIKKLDDGLNDYLKDKQFLSPENAANAADHWSDLEKSTGNPLYYIPEGIASLWAGHSQEMLMVLSSAKGGIDGLKSGVPGSDFVPSPEVTGPYVRPSGAGPTAEQRASVQGKPCVDCGAISAKQVADHIDPLVVQHYREGAVNVRQQSSPEAVQPHCPSCSASQGGELSAFSRAMKNLFGF